MTWARLDDQLHADPRLALAGLEAFGLHCAALSWMGAFLTDGEISLVQVKRLAGRRGPALAARLVEVGFWSEVSPTYFRVISWENSLISRSEVLRQREEKSKSGRAGARATNAKRLETGLAGAAASAGGASDAPDPVPIPSRPDPREKENKNFVEEAATPPPASAPALPGFEALVTLEEPQKPLPATSKAAATETEIGIFEAFLKGRKWRRVVKGAKPVLDPARLKVVRARLAEGFAADDLAAAAQGIWLSEWHFSEQQCRFDLALRDSEQIERFAKLHHDKLDEQAARNRGEEEPEEPSPFADEPAVLTDEMRADPVIAAFLQKYTPTEAAHG